MCVTDFAKTFDFYTTRFNFKPSDVSCNLACYILPLRALICSGTHSWCMMTAGAISPPSSISTVDLKRWITTAFSFSKVPSLMFITRPLRRMILILKSWDMTGFVTKAMRIAGAWADTSWALRFSIIGMGLEGLDSYWAFADWIRFDPSHFILEHYVDGDLVNDEYPTHRSLASPDSLHVWGKSSHLLM